MASTSPGPATSTATPQATSGAAFRPALRAARESRRPAPAPTRWVFVAYDQLHERFLTQVESSLSETSHPVGLVLVECPQKTTRRPYHQQKLLVLLSNLRHFAVEQAAVRDVHVVVARHDEVSSEGYGDALRRFIAELDVTTPVICFEAAERELRAELAPLVKDGLLEVRPHPGWLTTDADFAAAENGPKVEPGWRMDAFYRAVRRRTGILMDERGKPIGGRFSFDGDNRQPWQPNKPDTPTPPTPPTFAVDAITAECAELIRTRYGHHPGTLTPERCPASIDDARALWGFALKLCLPHFGPYEDAMSTHSSTLFHTAVSPLLNLHRLWPQDLLDDVLAADLPLQSQEGFVRQLIGWREFVRHVHRATDGFTKHPTLPSAPQSPHLPAPLSQASVLGADAPVPPAFWPDGWQSNISSHEEPSNQPATPTSTNKKTSKQCNGTLFDVDKRGGRSGLRCLDIVVDDVWRDAWSHHITRLMVLSNIATLLDVSPRALTDWFWVAYADAYDWVVEPNVMAMGTFGVGPLMTTKPYIAGAAYIDKMSDYCGGCAFTPKKAARDGGCPLTELYWAFLDRHEPALRDNQRLALPLASCRKRDAGKRAEDARVYETARRLLLAGERLSPACF